MFFIKFVVVFGINKTKSAAILLVFSFVLTAVSIPLAVAEVKTIVVPDDYSTIQEAVDAALEGDTVFVKSGTYANQSIVFYKSLSLIGENPETTIILGKSDVPFPAISFAVYFEADDVQISNFTVNTLIQVRGIFGSGTGIVVENNIIKSANSIGIGVYGDHNIITNNNLTTGVGGIHCSGLNNTVTGNRIDSSGSIAIGGSFNTISGNYLTTSGISVNGNSNTISNNHVKNSAVGIRLNNGSHNSVFENNVTGHSVMGIHLYNTSNNLIFDNYIANNIGNEGQQNGFGISLSGTRYHAENNTFYRNTLINNSYTVRIEEPYYVNYWDNGFEGNYWDDYNGTDADGDGIGNTPYIIDENNQDNYPIINHSTIPEFSSFVSVFVVVFVVVVVCFVFRRNLCGQVGER